MYSTYFSQGPLKFSFAKKVILLKFSNHLIHTVVILMRVQKRVGRQTSEFRRQKNVGFVLYSRGCTFAQKKLLLTASRHTLAKMEPSKKTRQKNSSVSRLKVLTRDRMYSQSTMSEAYFSKFSFILLVKRSQLDSCRQNVEYCLKNKKVTFLLETNL